MKLAFPQLVLGLVLCLPVNFLAAVPPPPTTQPTTRPAPKPISDNVKKGLAWLVANQLENGAWGQGEESRHMGEAMTSFQKKPNVADTSMAVMALLRGGSNPQEGEYKANSLKAIEFICSQIEEADTASLWVTTLRGTRTQTKLGTYVDTFFAAQVLAEVRNRMPNEASKSRVEKAIAKVVKKIESNQKEDGQWVNTGWAPVLAQAQAAKCINSLVQNGQKVNEVVRERAEQYAQSQYKNGPLNVGRSVGGKGATRPSMADDAGVALYASGAQIGTLNASAVSNAALEPELEAIARSATTRPADREMATQQLIRYRNNADILKQANASVLSKVDDKDFIAGFGSNGGEEFLSYLNIGESLFVKGGDDWRKWDNSISAIINKVQNSDGSWSGHHCITGRTFCTAAALQVLLIDHSPIPLAKGAVR